MTEEKGLEAKISKRLLGYVLIGVLAGSLIVVSYIMGCYETKTQELEDIKERLARLEGQVSTTAKYVSIGNITLRFEAYMPIQSVPGNTITYLLGFARVSNLKNIVVRPITLNVFFEPTLTQTGNGTITYDYTSYQSLEISSPDLDSLSLPWGAFPITLENFVKGDEINWVMNVTAVVEWMGFSTTQTSLTVAYKMIVSG